MTDRPIIFSAPMVRALLNGFKTQTRRILKPQPKFGFTPWFETSNGEWMQSGYGESGDDLLRVRFMSGDRLYVRENHAFVGGSDPGLLLCQADWQQTAALHGCDNAETAPRWTPSIHMMRHTSRLTLTVTKVRVQRLQDISEDDAVAEGVGCLANGLYHWDRDRAYAEQKGFHRPRGAFDALWTEINGPTAWVDNPWVAALTFTVAKQNIDAQRLAA